MQTFLFTDIEASTRLWSRAPVAMAAAVQRQEAILRAAIAHHRGDVFKTVGDGVYAVFPQAEDAVAAAMAAQQALRAESWTGFEPATELAVRIAIHSGSAEARDGDYFGPTLSRLSRTLDAAHGGQILCTNDTLAACGENWPAGIDLRDLGERTLRDVPGSGRIFQLIAPGLPEHFPPLATLDPRVHNLPRWPASLIGREEDETRLRAQLRSPDARLVSLLGTGGVGKTRLACEVASQLLDEFQDGIRFVDLSALREDAQVIPAIVQVTGATDQLLTPREALLDWLHTRSLLLLLDNCEQVVEGVAAIASDILSAAPEVVILATSRTPIRIRAERQLALDPLPLPTDTEQPETNPGVRLFVERAREVSDRFTIDPDSTAEVAEICRIVDGLPLAIELAAAWVRTLSPQALQRRLQESRAMLRGGARDLPDRQRALASTIAWSYDLLDPDDQRAFRRLAVFRGGIAVDAAAAVMWESPIDDPVWALARLDALVQANLLQVSTDPTGEPRFVMLQTIQGFAAGILERSGEWDEAAAAHGEFFAKLAEEAREYFRTDDVGSWFDRLDRELENFRAAVECFASLPEPSQRGLEMAIALWEFLDQRGHELEARTWINAFFENPQAFDARLQARALLLLGNSWMGNYEQAETFYVRAAAAAQEARDENLQRSIEASLGFVALLTGDTERAIKTITSIVDQERRANNRARLGFALAHLANCYCEASRFDDAIQTVNEASGLEPDPIGSAWLELIRGRALRRSGKIEEALCALEQARADFAQVDAKFDETRCLCEMAAALVYRDSVAARRAIAEANGYFFAGADPYTAANALDINAAILASEGDFDAAATLLASVSMWRQSTGATLSRHDRQERETRVRQIRLALGDDHYQRCVAKGDSLSLRAAFEFVQAAAQPVSSRLA